LPDNLGMGMILATIGLLVAILVGMVLVNWGIRKGYATHLEGSDSSKGAQLCGPIPKEKQRSIGSETVYSGSINSFALQFCLLMICLFLGNQIISWITIPFPAAKAIPMMTRGMLGALIIWPLMVKTKLDGYADKRTIDTISGFCLELAVFAAIATMRLDLVTKFFAPILIFSLVFTVMMIFVVIWFSKRICKDDWFEKAVLHFGQATGTMATGLALMRCVDPEMKSTSAESASMANTFTLPITAISPALLPLLILTSPSAVIVIGFALAAVCLVLGRMFCWKKP